MTHEPLLGIMNDYFSHLYDWTDEQEKMKIDY